DADLAVRPAAAVRGAGAGGEDVVEVAEGRVAPVEEEGGVEVVGVGRRGAAADGGRVREDVLAGRPARRPGRVIRLTVGRAGNGPTALMTRRKAPRSSPVVAPWRSGSDCARATRRCASAAGLARARLINSSMYCSASVGASGSPVDERRSRPSSVSRAGAEA